MSCEGNPDQAKRTESGERKTPAIGDHQARKLLGAPEEDTVKSKRDRAILSTLLFHALRRGELCKLNVDDFRHARKGVPHLKVSGRLNGLLRLPGQSVSAVKRLYAILQSHANWIQKVFIFMDSQIILQST
jgi:integrase/recombinase XerD